jgi:peroxiredoxin
MNIKRILLSVLLFPLFLSAQNYYKQGYFVMKGHVKNPKQQYFQFALSNYLAFSDNSTMIQPDGSFQQTTPIQNRQTLYVYEGDNILMLTVLDKDTLDMDWDAADFKSSFAIKGKDSLRTKELQFQAKLHFRFFQRYQNLQNELYEKEKTLTAENKFGMINELYNQHVKTILDSADFSTATLDYHIADLYYRYSNLLWHQQLVPKFNLKLNLDSTKSYPGFDVSQRAFNYTQLNEEWFWQVPEYRYFIFNYVRFHKPFNSWRHSSSAVAKPFNPTLDQYYLAQHVFDSNSIKDWFITHSIIEGFGYHAFADVEKVYHQFTTTCTTPYLKDTLHKYYTAMKRLKPGSPAPGFILKNDKGQTVSLSSFKGKVVYIDFWGIGCVPCIYEIEKNVPRLHKKYKDKEVVFINICVDANEMEWKEALAKYQLDGVNLIAEGWVKHPVCKAYNVNGIPHQVLIDKAGTISNNNAPRPGAYELNAAVAKNPIDLLLK